MLGRNIGLVTAGAVGATAFLLPPGVSEKFVAIETAIKPQQSEPWNVVLHCSTCVAPQTDPLEEGEFQVQSVGADVSVKLEVSKDGSEVLLNGSPIYPDFVPAQEVAILKHTANEVEEIGTRPVTASQIDVEMVGEEGKDHLFKVDFIIEEIDGHEARLDAVKVLILDRSADNMPLYIMDVTTLPRPPPVPTALAHASAEECGNLPRLVCQLRAIFLKKMEHVRSGKHGPCPGKKGGHPGPVVSGMRPTHPHDRRPPHHFEQDGHHRHHGHHQNSKFQVFIASFVQGLSSVLVPLTLGFVFGMGTIFVAYMIGTLALKVIRRLQGQHTYEPVGHEEEGFDEEDKFVPPPPQYEEAPLYEEVVAEAEKAGRQ